MSKIKELRTESTNSINLVDTLTLFVPENKSKYVEMILKLMKKTTHVTEHSNEIKNMLLKKHPYIKMDELDKFEDFQLIFMNQFLDSLFRDNDLNDFNRFCEYNERGLIGQNDITTYKSFEEILTQLNITDLRVNSKELESQISKVYEDDEWLLVRPLTFLSSKKYGANTKWCTTSEHNSEYFNRYSSNGVLIYCINKKTGYKVASYCALNGDNEFSFWNQKDEKIESLQSELTLELLGIIQTESKHKNAKTNRYLLSDDQRSLEDKMLGVVTSLKSKSILPPTEDVPYNRTGMLSNRIERALTRNTDEDGSVVNDEEESVGREERDDIESQLPFGFGEQHKSGSFE